MINVQHVIRNVESTVGVTVFFDEDLSEEEIQVIGRQIGQREEVDHMEFTSADEAWENFSKEYFEGMEDLAEGFVEDNPLANDASFEIFLKDISDQDAFVEYLESLSTVRRVNYSTSVVSGLTSFNTVMSLLFMVIIGVLLAVSVFLISNTINVAAQFRKNENEIMRYIGATNYMIRAPFVVEGMVIGLMGAFIPLLITFVLYSQTIKFIEVRFQVISDIFQFLAIQEIFPFMAGISVLLGLGIGFFASFFTIRKHLKV